MSWVRFGTEGSAVYVYDHVDGYIECCQCLFGGDFKAKDEIEMIAHLRKHQAAGHHVPDWVFGEGVPDLPVDDRNITQECEKCGVTWWLARLERPVEPYICPKCCGVRNGADDLIVDEGMPDERGITGV
jgi:hypothetical protein